METNVHAEQKSYFSKFHFSLFKRKDSAAPSHVVHEELDGADIVTTKADTAAEANDHILNVLVKVDSLGDLPDKNKSVEGNAKHGDDAKANADTKNTNANTDTNNTSTTTSTSTNTNTNTNVDKNDNKENSTPTKPTTGEGAKSEQESATWLSKAKDNIKYTFISKETEEAFGEIGILFEKMFVDFPYNKVDLLFGLMMLDDYYKNAPVLSASRMDDYQFVESARYYMKFAYCCYGWKFVYGILNRKTQKFFTSMVGVDANTKALYDCTHVEPKDVIVAKWTSTLFDSGHYVCLCRERKTIVVAFRGTFHIRDALTDLVASNTPFMQGSAHTGFLRTATNKYRILAPTVLKCYEENPTYKIVVVGHSLGAGTAALFTLLFREAHPEVPIHCYAYAPPCVLSPDVALSSSTVELIDSIVVGTDIVPRLSFATLNHLKQVIMQILASGNNTFQRAFQWMAGGMKEGLRHRLAGMLKVPEAAKIEPGPVPISDVSVFPPGRISLLVPHIIGEDSDSSDEGGNDGDDTDGDVSPDPSSSPLSSSPPNLSPRYLSCSPPNDSSSTQLASSPPKIAITPPKRSPSPPSLSSSPPDVSFPSNSSPPSTIAPISTSPTSAFSILSPLSALYPHKIPALFKSTPKPPKPKKVYLMEYSNSALFNEIIISPSMFTCHMPSAYDKALESCLNFMQENQGNPTKMQNVTARL